MIECGIAAAVMLAAGNRIVGARHRERSREMVAANSLALGAWLAERRRR